MSLKSELLVRSQEWIAEMQDWMAEKEENFRRDRIGFKRKIDLSIVGIAVHVGDVRPNKFERRTGIEAKDKADQDKNPDELRVGLGYYP